jgi:Mn-dependent DtxR family transcriptional regulator
MLAEIFGMDWYEVHDEAERLEQAVSAAFEKKLIEKLGRPQRHMPSREWTDIAKPGRTPQKELAVAHRNRCSSSKPSAHRKGC